MSKRKNEELNQAMLKVMTTKYKKDAKEAHKLVEDYGYEIVKRNGMFWVIHPKTKKYIYIDEVYGYGGYYYYVNYCSGTKKVYIKKRPDILNNFDFVNCLGTPENTAYRDSIWRERYCSTKYKEIRKSIKDTKRCIMWEECDIKNTEHKIKNLQDKLMYYATRKNEYEKHLNELRKQVKEMR